MGRWLTRSSDFTEWQARFSREVTAAFGAEFAEEVAVEIDRDVAAFGEPDAAGRVFLEIIASGIVLARRTEVRRG